MLQVFWEEPLNDKSMPIVLTPATLLTVLSIANVLPDKENPPLSNVRMAVSKFTRSLTFACWVVPLKISGWPMFGTVPLQFSGVVQLLLAPAPVQVVAGGGPGA